MDGWALEVKLNCKQKWQVRSAEKLRSHGRSRPREKKWSDDTEKKVKFRLFLISFAFNLKP